MVTELLRAIPLFRNLPSESLEAVASRLRIEHYERGAIVFRRGDPADALYLVRSGQVEVVVPGTEEPVAFLGPRSFVGEMGLLLEEPRSATLRVASDAELWVLARDDLKALLAEHLPLALNLSEELSRRLAGTTRRLAPPAVTRFTALWGEATGKLARVLLEAKAGPVGVLALPGAPSPGRLPADCVALAEEHLDAETLAGWAGREVQGLAHLLMVLPPRPSPLVDAALALSEHVVSFGKHPGWAHPPALRHRLLRSDGSPASLRRTVRWITDRAVGLALSSGGSKTLAHLGVHRVLAESGVEIDAVAGSSGGALVAAGLAIGLTHEEMMAGIQEFARHLTIRWFDVNPLPLWGVLKGARLRNRLDSWFGGRTFTETDIPLWVVATDVETGEEVVIDRGPLADGLRASMSIPGAFSPWRWEGRLLMDGGVVNPLPASVLRDAGVRFVIGSSVVSGETTGEAPSGARAPHLLQMMFRVIGAMEREVAASQLALVDVAIRPRVSTTNPFDFSRIEQFIAEGERAAREQFAQLQRLASVS